MVRAAGHNVHHQLLIGMVVASTVAHPWYGMVEVCEGALDCTKKNAISEPRLV